MSDCWVALLKIGLLGDGRPRRSKHPHRWDQSAAAWQEHDDMHLLTRQALPTEYLFQCIPSRGPSILLLLPLLHMQSMDNVVCIHACLGCWMEEPCKNSHAPFVSGPAMLCVVWLLVKKSST